MLLLVGMMSIGFLTGTAEAQASDRFPGSVQVDIQGERHQAFSLGGFTELLRIDSDLMLAAAQVALLDEMLEHATSRIVALESANVSCTARVTTLQGERTRLLDMWTTENRLRIEAENRPAVGSFVAWILVAAEAVALAMLAGVIAAQ